MEPPAARNGLGQPSSPRPTAAPSMLQSLARGLRRARRDGRNADARAAASVSLQESPASDARRQRQQRPRQCGGPTCPAAALARDTRCSALHAAPTDCSPRWSVCPHTCTLLRA
eukprot:scaffold2455_cov387-Prasinococcus_capsulatus_cf.AAC.6